MNVSIRQVNDKLHFEGVNKDGKTVQIDGVSGEDSEGMNPMELMLTSVGACSAVDVVEILKKQRQKLEHLEVELNGERPEDTVPRPYKAIQIHFIICGDVDESKAGRAVELAVEKYCSAADSLDRDIKISHSFEIKESEKA